MQMRGAGQRQLRGAAAAANATQVRRVGAREPRAQHRPNVATGTTATG